MYSSARRSPRLEAPRPSNRSDARKRTCARNTSWVMLEAADFSAGEMTSDGAAPIKANAETSSRAFMGGAITRHWPHRLAVHLPKRTVGLVHHLHAQRLKFPSNSIRLGEILPLSVEAALRDELFDLIWIDALGLHRPLATPQKPGRRIVSEKPGD